MKLFYSIVLLPLFIFSDLIAQNPRATDPGGYSTTTGASFNIPYENFQVFDYVGYKEDRLIKYTMKNIIKVDEVTEASQHKFFDSLSDLRDAYLKKQNIGSGAIAPNVVAIKENFYIDETEIANFHWQEFLYYIKRDSSADFYNRMLPIKDIIKLTERDFFQIGEEEGMEGGIFREDTYFSHPAYRYFPVVGISYEQAQAYCKWRSDFASEIYNQKNKNKEYRVKFNFRLPTEEEWELVASCGLDKKKYPFGLYGDPMSTVRIDLKAADYISKRIDNPPAKETIIADIKKYNESNPKDLYFNCKREQPYFLRLATPFYIYNAPPLILVFSIWSETSLK